MNQTISPVCILLVEDNQDDIELTRIALESMPSTRIYIVRDGQAALDFLFRQGEFEFSDLEPDLVLLDIHLPKCDGIDVLRGIRSHPALSAMPVVMLTASAREEDIDASYRFGCNTYIQKPVEFSEFEKAMKLIREYWGDLAKLPATAFRK